MLPRAKRQVALLLVIVVAGTLGTPAGLTAAESDSLAWPASAGLVVGRGQAPLTPEAAIATAAPDGVHVVSSSATGVTFELAVPWEQLRLEPVTAEGKGYVHVSLPDWQATGRAGAPILPVLTRAIGAPLGVDVTVSVVPGRAHRLALSAPPLRVATPIVEWDTPVPPQDSPFPPAPSSVLEEDPAVYRGAEAYPGPLAELTGDAVVREQRVVGVAAYPVQYHPQAQELTVYESLRVEVRFQAWRAARPEASVAEPAALESAAYESVFREQLLNAETARAWRSGTLNAGLSFDRRRGEGLEGAEDLSSALESREMQAATVPWTPPDPGWRIKVREDGFYRLTYSDLQAAGVPVDSADPRTFQLYHLGSEVAMHVEGEADGVFDEGDTLLFYGEAVASKYTADNVYWLTYGQQDGVRIATRDGTPGTADVPAHYAARRHMEGNQFYVPLAPGDRDLDRWFWDYLYPPSRPSWTHTFSLAGPTTEPATLTVTMLGHLDHPISPDHHVEISLNGELVSDVLWDGITWQIAEMEIPAGLLMAGDNTLEVVGPNDTGLGYDLVYIESVELEFANTFVAEDEALSFSYDDSGIWKFQVDGFTSDRIAVYDVTDPAAVERIEGVEVVGSGTYSVVFQDGVVPGMDYWALAEGAYRTVDAIEADTPSNLGSTAQGADHIVIGHRNFLAQAEVLRDYRASQGLRALAVDVQDVYDEFGYGIEGAAPIRAFLAYAYANWQPPAPSFVVLLGDGHYDPKNYQYARASYLPPYLAPVDPWMGETAADNRYVTLVGDDLMPDMMLGRLAVNSTAEATAFVEKIVGYEEAPAGDWQQRVLAVADDADRGGDFPQMSDDLLGCCLYEPYQAEKIYYGVTHTNTVEAREAIRAGINAGQLLVNYLGHAYTQAWAQENLFTSAHVDMLENSGKLPVMLAMTCREGYYHFPHASASYDALAEVVTRAEGKGAVASWSPAGLGVATGHSHLNRGFYRAVFQDGLVTLGQATSAGKLNLWATGTHLDLLDTYLLFGDPALDLPVEVEPQADLHVEKTGPEEVSPGETITYAIAWGNGAGVAAPGVVVTDTLPAGVTYVADDSGWAASEAEPGVMVWTAAPDPLPAGASGSFVVTATVGLDVEGPLVNYVRIAAAVPDADPTDNEDHWVTDLPSGWRVYLPLVVRSQ